MRNLLLSLMIGFSACAPDATSDRPAAPGSAAGRPDVGVVEEADLDAGPRDASGESPDFRYYVIALLIEVDRALVSTCPCQVEEGDFPSMQQCVEAVSLGLDWFDCVNAADLPDPDPDLLATLRCQLVELDRQSTCLEATTCNSKASSDCLSDWLSCPPSDSSFVARLFEQCPDLLSR